MTKEEHDKIIDFVNSEDYMLLNSYISKPYEETIIEQDKEIEKLNKEIEEYKKDYDRIYTENCKLRQEHNITDISLLDENYRLNNIINKLEKILYSNQLYGEKVFESSGLTEEEFKQQHPYTLGSYDNSVNLLERIRELKEASYDIKDNEPTSK